MSIATLRSLRAAMEQAVEGSGGHDGMPAKTSAAHSPKALVEK